MATLTEVARRLNARRRGTLLPPVLMLTDERRLPDPLPAARALPRGAGVVLRHYGVPERAVLAAQLARVQGVVLLVAGDMALARRVRAAGLHLPEGAAPPPRLRPRRFLVTMAAHSIPALRRAKALGADAAVLSPVFPTASHPGARTLGPLRFAVLARAAGLPVYALGGISAANAPQLSHSGAVGLAAIGGLAGPAARR